MQTRSNAVQVEEQSTESLRRDPTKLRCLILNADFSPLSTFPPSIISAQDAISALWRQRAYVVEEWPDAFFRSPSTQIAVPKVLSLREYANIHARPKFNRRNILLRDRFTCQYCGNRFDSQELTYDHCWPRSLGGKTAWDNVVACCVPCNAKKANRPPNFSGRSGVIAADGSMRPLKPPRQPSNIELLRAGLELLPNDVKQDFGSWLYWDAELQ